MPGILERGYLKPITLPSVKNVGHRHENFGQRPSREPGSRPRFQLPTNLLGNIDRLFSLFHHNKSVQSAGPDISILVGPLLPRADVFALSGFLVTASAGRLSLKNFLFSRGLRIVPALAVDTLVCTLIIGPIFTRVALSDYFSNADFFKFYLNIIGWVHYSLPGVFDTLPVPKVNGSLWTVPFEIFCYFLISILIIIRMVTSKLFVLSLTLAYLIVSVGIEHYNVVSFFHSYIVPRVINVIFLDYEAQAVTGFLFGIVFYQNRYVIPYSKLLFAFCCAVSLVLAFSMTMDLGAKPLMRFVLMPTIAYETMFLGLTVIRLPRFFETGDYSYGIYLYHQPFLQILIVLFPVAALAPHYAGSVFVFIFGLPASIAVAWLSWHAVERPTLSLRKRLAPTRGSSATAAAPRTELVTDLREVSLHPSRN